MSLELLRCPSCGGDVAAVSAASTRCRYCAADVPVPAAHLQALALQGKAITLRREIEAKWRRMTAEASWWTEWVAAALILFLPPCVSLFAALVVWFPLAMVDGLVFVSIPALLPGAVLWVWAIGSRATVQRIDRELGAGPPARAGGDPTCRACGAPLVVEADALAATCLYCGTDSLLGAGARERVTSRLGSKVRTLEDALRMWRIRVLLLGAGLVVVALPMAGLAALLWIALRVAA